MDDPCLISPSSPIECPWDNSKEAPKVAAAEDPWAHRSDGMRCRTCMWFVEKVTTGLNRVDPVGRCRRHAPTMNGYPVVFASDWCGDHKLNENAI